MTTRTFTEDEGSVGRSTIAVWHGQLSDIPEGWALADGNNGTPDLRGEFLKPSADYSNGSGASGGQHSFTMSQSQLPSHDHTGNTYSSGGHDHTIKLFGLDSGSWNTDYWTNYSGDRNFSMSSVSSHSHGSGYSNNTGSGNSVDNRPDFYEAAFIIKL